MSHYLSLVATEEDFAQPNFELRLGQLAEDIDRKNQEEYRLSKRRHQQAMEDLIAIYGSKSRQARYLENEPPPSPPRISTQKRNILKKYNDWKNKQIEAQQRAARRQRAAEQRAIKKRQAEERRLAEIEEHKQKRAMARDLEKISRYRSRATADELIMAGFHPYDFLVRKAITFSRGIIRESIYEEGIVSTFYDEWMKKHPASPEPPKKGKTKSKSVTPNEKKNWLDNAIEMNSRAIEFAVEAGFDEFLPILRQRLAGLKDENRHMWKIPQFDPDFYVVDAREILNFNSADLHRSLMEQQDKFPRIRGLVIGNISEHEYAVLAECFEEWARKTMIEKGPTYLEEI